MGYKIKIVWYPYLFSSSVKLQTEYVQCVSVCMSEILRGSLQSPSIVRYPNFLCFLVDGRIRDYRCFQTKKYLDPWGHMAPVQNIEGLVWLIYESVWWLNETSRVQLFHFFISGVHVVGYSRDLSKWGGTIQNGLKIGMVVECSIPSSIISLFFISDFHLINYSSDVSK